MMMDVTVGNDVLQRIADMCNWLTYDESSVAHDEYNEVVTLFMVLERNLAKTYGWNDIVTNGCSPKLEKTILDFIKWRSDCFKVANDLESLIDSGNIEFVSDDDEKILWRGVTTIWEFVNAVLNMKVTVEKDVI